MGSASNLFKGSCSGGGLRSIHLCCNAAVLHAFALISLAHSLPFGKSRVGTMESLRTSLISLRPRRRTIIDLFGLLLPSWMLLAVIGLSMSASSPGGWDGVNMSLLYWGAPLFVLASLPSFLVEVLRSHGSRHLEIGTFRIVTLQDARTFYFVQFEMSRLYGTTVSLFDMASTDVSRCRGESPNADIVGLGVRSSIYILLFSGFISLFIASFHRSPSGTKELGAATLVSMCHIGKLTHLFPLLCQTLMHYRPVDNDDQSYEAQANFPVPD